MSQHELVFREAYLHERDAVVDIAINDGTITEIGTVPDDGEKEIDAGGNLVSPGLVDCHTHYDWAFSARGKRRPQGNETPYDQTKNIDRLAEYMESASKEEIRDSVTRGMRAAVAQGVLHGRTHAYAHTDIGTKDVEAVLTARDSLAPTFDLQVVSFPQQGYLGDSGVADVTREALELGADYVGGIDPASVNEDIEGTLDIWFDLASEFGASIDAHLHDPGSVGRYTIGRFAEMAVERGFTNRVTASHAYALGDESQDPARFPQGDLEYVLDQMSEAEMSVITCYMTTPSTMPIEAIDAYDIALGHGTDQIQDLWFAHGNADVVQGAMVNSLKLEGNKDYSSNPGLQRLWEMLTTGSAQALGLEAYGIEVGTPANLVVYDEPSPEWVIIRQSTPSHVVSSGTVIAREGTLTADIR